MYRNPLYVIPVVGSTHCFRFSPNEQKCDCAKKDEEPCGNKHQFLYVFLSVEEEHTLVKCCGLKSHKKKIYDTMIKGKNVKYHLYRKVDQLTRYDYCDYVCAGVNVDDTFHYNNPLVGISLSVNEIKTNLKTELDENKEEIANLTNDIRSLQSAITSMTEEVHSRRRRSTEIDRAITFANKHTVYKPSSIGCKRSGICSICCDEMTSTNASQLYECSHVFHNGCIEKWFKEKNKLTCPMCRADCSVNNYFKLDTN